MRVPASAFLVSALAACAIATPSAVAQEPDIGFESDSRRKVEFSGSVGVETRVFPQKPRFDGQFDHWQTSLIFDPEFAFESDDRRHQLVLHPYLRYDFEDDERTHFDIREVYWLFNADTWDLLLGADRVFWGVTESRHLVDVINQVDGVEDIDEEDRLGQPMLRLGTTQPWGRLSLFVMPYFRERTFPGADGRLRGPLPVDTDGAVYESGAEEWHTDVALRYKHTLGGLDIGAHWFRGTDREPRLLPNDAGTALIPHYDIINQGGLDVQYTRDAWLLKFEGLVREGQGDTFFASVAGFEYTFYQVFGTASDIGVLAEHLYDGRDASAPPTFYDNDVFVGLRWAANDPQDTSILLGGIVDTDDASSALLLEAERRLGESWKLALEARVFANAEDDPVLASVQDDSFVSLRMSRHF